MTLIPLTYYGYAAGFAATVIFAAWVLETLVGRQLGFWLNVAVILLVLAICTFNSYRELTECMLSSTPAFPQCEWSAASFWLVVGLTLTALPLLIVSAVLLRLRSSRPA